MYSLPLLHSLVISHWRYIAQYKTNVCTAIKSYSIHIVMIACDRYINKQWAWLWCIIRRWHVYHDIYSWFGCFCRWFLLSSTTINARCYLLYTWYFINPWSQHFLLFTCQRVCGAHIGLLLFFKTFMDGQVYLWESLMFLALYIIYVITVILGRCLFQRWKANNNTRLGRTDQLQV